MPQTTTYKGVIYTDPRDNLRLRAVDAKARDDEYFSIPMELADALLYRPKYCEARTTINADRFARTLVEVKCTRELDPVTGKHTGWHKNGKNTWE